MIERIVVPLDGSLTAEAVLPQVRRILHRNDSELLLVRAVVPAPAENAILIADAASQAAREYVHGVQTRLDREGVRVRSEVRVGSTIGVILDVVEDWKATMIAMATHGTTGLKRVLLGSVAEAVLRKSPVPVLVVRPFWSSDEAPSDDVERRPIRTLLVPVDGSDLSGMVVPAALEFSSLFDPRVLLLRVLEAKKKGEGARELEEAKSHLQGMAKPFERKGIDTLQIVERGDPVHQILETARFHEADLIAMTTHGRSGIGRLVTGSVTEQVLRRSPVPLLVVRAAAPARPKRRALVAKRR
ncbi:MAG TPA: universal stress protein [Planctomycetota bacterium]|nr:universal stress protein [Planctomycetota bacterium]